MANLSMNKRAQKALDEGQANSAFRSRLTFPLGGPTYNRVEKKNKEGKRLRDKKGQPIIEWIPKPCNLISLTPFKWIVKIWLHCYDGKTKGKIKPYVVCRNKMYGQDCDLCAVKCRNEKGQTFDNNPQYFMIFIGYVPEFYGATIKIEGKTHKLKPIRVFIIPIGKDSIHYNLFSNANDEGKFNKTVFQLSNVSKHQGGKGFDIVVLSQKAKGRLPNEGKIPKDVVEKIKEMCPTIDEFWQHSLNCVDGVDWDNYGVEQPEPPSREDYSEEDADESAEDEDEDDDETPKKSKKSSKNTLSEDEEEDDDEEDEEDEEDEDDEELDTDPDEDPEEEEEKPKPRVKKNRE